MLCMLCCAVLCMLRLCCAAENMFVFVVDAAQADAWAPPAELDDYFSAPGFAGSGAVYCLFPPGSVRLHLPRVRT